MNKKTLIFLITSLLIVSVSGCGQNDGADTNSETTYLDKSAAVAPVECDSFVNVPAEYLYDNTLESYNPITVNMDGADSYTVSVNSGMYNDNGFQYCLDSYSEVATNDYGYIFNNNSKIHITHVDYCDTITVLAFSDEHIIGAAFLSVRLDGQKAYAYFEKSYAFEKTDGQYQNVTLEDIEALRAGCMTNYISGEKYREIYSASADLTEYMTIGGKTLYDAGLMNNDGTDNSFEHNPLVFSINDADTIKITSQSNHVVLCENQTLNDAVTDTSYTVSPDSPLYLLKNINGNEEIPDFEDSLLLEFYGSGNYMGFLNISVTGIDGKMYVRFGTYALYNKTVQGFAEIPQIYIDAIENSK